MVANYLKKRVSIILKNDEERQLINLLINGSNNFKVVAENPDYNMLESYLWLAKPDVVILDLQFEGEIHGVEAIRRIKKANAYCMILVISEIKVPDIVFASFKAGASSYLLNGGNIQFEIVDRLNELCKGGSPLSREIAKMVVNSFHSIVSSHLSKRESQILKLMSEGKTYSEISEELIVAPETAKSHIKNIYKKLKVKSKQEAIEHGIKKKIIYTSNFLPLIVDNGLKFKESEHN